MVITISGVQNQASNTVKLDDVVVFVFVFVFVVFVFVFFVVVNVCSHNQ